MDNLLRAIAAYGLCRMPALTFAAEVEFSQDAGPPEEQALMPSAEELAMKSFHLHEQACERCPVGPCDRGEDGECTWYTGVTDPGYHCRVKSCSELPSGSAISRCWTYRGGTYYSVDDINFPCQASKFVAARGGTNACPTGSARLSEAECRDAANALGMRAHDPFSISTSEDPKACFRFAHWIYFNTHPVGADRVGRTPYCKPTITTSGSSASKGKAVCPGGYTVETHSGDHHGDVCRKNDGSRAWWPPQGCERTSDGKAPWSVQIGTNNVCRIASHQATTETTPEPKSQTTLDPTSPPTPKPTPVSTTPACIASYGAAVGDPVCCGQAGHVDKHKHICPATAPACTGYILGASWGSCKEVASDGSTKAISDGPQPAYPSVFCFVVMMSDGYELDLMKTQAARKIGVFQCDGHTVFSDAEMQLAPALSKTTSIGDMHCPKCAWGSWCNGGVFLKAWQKLIAGGEFRQHMWTVKADPDTVFFPDRLRSHLVNLPHSEAVYLKNWNQKFGFLGPIEVFSRQAVERFDQGGLCRTQLKPEESGEDGYVQACMELLGVGHKDDFTLLQYSGGVGTCSRPMAAFHPFKSKDEFVQCFEAAAHQSLETPKIERHRKSLHTVETVPEKTSATSEKSKHAGSSEAAAAGFCCASASDRGDICGTCWAGARMPRNTFCGSSSKQCASHCGATWCPVSSDQGLASVIMRKSIRRNPIAELPAFRHLNNSAALSAFLLFLVSGAFIAFFHRTHRSARTWAFGQQSAEEQPLRGEEASTPILRQPGSPAKVEWEADQYAL